MKTLIFKYEKINSQKNVVSWEKKVYNTDIIEFFRYKKY